MSVYPKYEVRQQEGLGCHVLVTREKGHKETWVGFTGKNEAQAWIDKQTRLWRPEPATPPRFCESERRGGGLSSQRAGAQ